MRKALMVFSALFVLAACQHEQTETPEKKPSPEELAYQQCLSEHMTMAVAWEVIEDMCRKQVNGEPELLELNTEQPRERLR